ANSNGDKFHDKSPVRMLRTHKYKYIANIERGETVSRGRQPYESWVQLAATDAHAKKIVDRLNENPPEELYDLEHDRFELNNFAHLPQYRQLLDDFRARMETIRTKQGDIGDRWKEDLKRLPAGYGPNPLVPYSVN